MTYVSAEVMFGFQFLKGSPYLSQDWSDEDRAELKALVTREVAAKIPHELRCQWKFTATEVDAGGHVPEDAVRAFLAAKLDQLNSSGLPWTIELADRGPHTGPECVKYVYYDNTRVCVHCYELDIAERGARNPEPWEVSHKPSGKKPATARFMVELSWPTVFPG